MFDMTVTRKDIESIYNYIENKGLVKHMNDAGLSIGAMAVVIEAIDRKCEEILGEMDKEED